uniref:Retrovirus-related Pol polyprotein from transposon TNT 1-94 n=1 Tax=Cajanus cajan TaxID=3821 RepID=A0A151RK62_CAJCA|nr:Retrovirus-related Pol polyprotein from transposon TNT 1-94 [Cajanus cajan]
MKWLLRYLRGTSKMIFCFGSWRPELISYANANMVGDIDSRNSTFGYLIAFSTGVVLWQLKLQNCVALSTTSKVYCYYRCLQRNIMDEVILP